MQKSVIIAALCLLASQGITQSKFRLNTAPTVDGGLTLITQSILDNAKDSIFTLKVRAAKRLDVGVRRHLMMLVTNEAISGDSVKLTLRSEGIDTLQKLTKTYWLKKGHRPARCFPSDSITVWTEVVSVTKTQCRLRMFTTAYPLYPDTIIVQKRVETMAKAEQLQSLQQKEKP